MMTRSGEPTHGGPRRPASTASVALFLSLALLLLAFFIVLTALSSTQTDRVQAVMDSLSRTFADGRVLDGTRFTGTTGAVVGDARAFEAELAEMVATAVPAAVVRQTAVSHVSEVTLRADALFEPDGAAVRRSRVDLIDRLVAALSSAPPGLALTMEFTLGSDYDSSKTGAAARQRARAVDLAQALLARGVPPAAFAVGLDPALGDQARMRFRVLDLGAGAAGGQG